MNAALMRIVALIGVLATMGGALVASQSPVAAALRQGGGIAGIIIGTDYVDFARHSDTLMLWHYDPKRSRVDVLSIPRDTKIDLPGYRFRRINEVFSYHFGIKRDPHAASREVLSALERLLRLDALPPGSFRPEYYVHVDYEGFRRFIDLLGGIDIHIDEPLHYDDNAGNYHFHKEPGDHHLSAEEALMYVRFRGRSGDRGRILRQMEFLKAVAGRMSFPLLSVRTPQLLSAVYRSIHTRFSPADLLFLVLETKHLRPDRLNPWLLPGQVKGVYWEIDPERTELVLRQMAGVAAETETESAPQPASAPDPQAAEAKPTVKVWNGTGRSGMALQATRRLRAAGFDVLEWGNYNLRQGKTRIMDRRGDIEKARRVGRALGVESVFSDINPKLRTDVEVILGDDYKAGTRD